MAVKSLVALWLAYAALAYLAFIVAFVNLP